MSDVTRLLAAVEAGDRRAAADLLPLVYDELRKLAAARMAAESPDHTLQPTALVHEAYLRLVGPADAARWENRGHFFAAATEQQDRVREAELTEELVSFLRQEVEIAELRHKAGVEAATEVDAVKARLADAEARLEKVKPFLPNRNE
jgi:hypothetical protein